MKESLGKHDSSSLATAADGIYGRGDKYEQFWEKEFDLIDCTRGCTGDDHVHEYSFRIEVREHYDNIVLSTVMEELVNTYKHFVDKDIRLFEHWAKFHVDWNSPDEGPPFALCVCQNAFKYAGVDCCGSITFLKFGTSLKICNYLKGPKDLLHFCRRRKK